MATRQEIKRPKPAMLIGLVLLFSAIALAAAGLVMHVTVMLYAAGAAVLLATLFLLVGMRRNPEISG